MAATKKPKPINARQLAALRRLAQGPVHDPRCVYGHATWEALFNRGLVKPTGMDSWGHGTGYTLTKRGIKVLEEK